MILLLLAAIRIAGPGEPPPAEYKPVPPPRIEMRVNVASASTVPWIDSNGWRFNRGLKQAYYKKLPPGAAALAAAEAFAYGVDAVLEPAPEDDAPLKKMLSFLDSVKQAPMPPLANIGVLDDGAPVTGEVMNLLGRRNLMYKAVSKPDSSLALNVRIGSADFPKEAAANPSDFAARVREKLGDEKRLVRLYGTYTVIAHLTGEGGRARLHLLNYSRRLVKDLRVRVLGVYGSAKLAEASSGPQPAKDFVVFEGGTEVTVPSLQTYAVVDFEERKK